MANTTTRKVKLKRERNRDNIITRAADRGREEWKVARPLFHSAATAKYGLF